MAILETKRLILRPLTDTDIEELLDYRNDIRCAKFQRGQTKDRAGLENVIAQHRADNLISDGKKLFAVAKKDGGSLIGDIAVFLEDPTISIGYTISYKHHRQGYAFEILSALTDHLHHIYPTRELISLVEPANLASIALLKKLGYQDLGYAPKITSQIYGKWTIEEI